MKVSTTGVNRFARAAYRLGDEFSPYTPFDATFQHYNENAWTRTYQIAIDDYKKNRTIDSVEQDAPCTCSPTDGSVTWVKGEIKGGYVYGVKEGDGKYHYECRYDEGPGDKLWMEECDWYYIQRISRKGRLLKLEPNVDKEIAKDHKYRVEITRALAVAHAIAGAIAGIGSAGERSHLEGVERERQTEIKRLREERDQAIGTSETRCAPNKELKN